MIEIPQITQTTARPTAIIPLTIPVADIHQVMGPGISELMSTISVQGIQPAGPWFTHHVKPPWDVFDFEISIPVSAPVRAAGRVKPSQWPAMKVARTVYQGPYEELGAAWEEFMDWIETNGHKPAPELWESYVAGPESSPDPANWRTELIRPLLS